MGPFGQTGSSPDYELRLRDSTYFVSRVLLTSEQKVKNYMEAGNARHPNWQTLVTKENILATLRAERTCDEWAKWHPSLTPKEYREMVDREALRKWQDGRAR